jgi:hypothetical protein
MFRTDGVFLFVGMLLMPMLKDKESENANEGRWQLAQLTVESFDRNFSLNNNSPNFFLLNFFDWLSMNEDANKHVNKMKIIGNIALFKCLFLFYINATCNVFECSSPVGKRLILWAFHDCKVSDHNCKMVFEILLLTIWRNYWKCNNEEIVSLVWWLPDLGYYFFYFPSNHIKLEKCKRSTVNEVIRKVLLFSID